MSIWNSSPQRELTTNPLSGKLGADQQFARYLLLNDTTDRAAWSEEDIEVLVARFREPAPAPGQASPLPRLHHARGRANHGRAYRNTRLTTPNRLLAGAQRSFTSQPQFLGGYENYADDLALEIVDSASHFIADERPAAVVEHALELFTPPDHRGLHR